MLVKVIILPAIETALEFEVRRAVMVVLELPVVPSGTTVFDNDESDSVNNEGFGVGVGVGLGVGIVVGVGVGEGVALVAVPFIGMVMFQPSIPSVRSNAMEPVAVSSG